MLLTSEDIVGKNLKRLTKLFQSEILRLGSDLIASAPVGEEGVELEIKLIVNGVEKDLLLLNDIYGNLNKHFEDAVKQEVEELKDKQLKEIKDVALSFTDFLREKYGFETEFS